MAQTLTNHEREVLVEKIAKLLDHALRQGHQPLRGAVVKDGDLEPIYNLINHYRRNA